MNGGGKEDGHVKTATGKKAEGGKMTEYKEQSSYLMTQQLYS